MEDNTALDPFRLSAIADEVISINQSIAGSTTRRNHAELLGATRRIQRLLDTTVTELISAARHDDSAPPLESLLSDDGAIPRSQVHAEIDRLRIHRTFPEIADARSAGGVSTANVDVLARATRALTDQETEAMTGHGPALADAAARLGEDSFRKRVTRLRDKIRCDGGTTAAEQVIADAFVRVTPNRERDAYRLAGHLDPIRGASIHAAISREAATLAAEPGIAEGSTPAQLAAQALHDLVLRGDRMDRADAPRANVQIHVLADWDTLDSGPHDDAVAETHHGVAVGPNTIGRLCCDATLRRVAAAPDARVHVSHTRRTPTPAQRAALRALYPCCPISGAGWESIEIHHVVFFEQSQRTVLDELVPISRRWHHLIHDEGWQLTMATDRTLQLSRPDGTPFRTIAPPTPVIHSGRADHELAA